MLGGTKQSYIWTVNGTVWYIVNSLAGNKILAQQYGDQIVSTWSIPESLFDAEFIEAKDLRYMSQVVSHEPKAGWSTRLLRSDYAGAATEVRRVSDNVTLDIGFLDAYSYDVPAFDTHIGASTGTLETWYDQFNANDSNQATNANQPLITPTSGSNGRTSLNYDGSNDFMPVNSLSAGFSGVQTPFTWLALIRSESLASSRSFLTAGSSTTNSPFIVSRFINTPFNRFIRSDNAAVQDIMDINVPVVDTYYIVGIMFDGIDVFFLWNGVQTKVTAAVLGQITLNRFTIGAFIRAATIQLWDGDIDEAFVWDSAIGVKDLALASYNMSQFYAVY